jgi:hypothetical protein
MKRVEGALEDRLLDRGMKLSSMPAYIRNVLNTMEAQPLLSLDELNRRLHVLGWGDVELDSCTFQLIKANYGADRRPDLPMFADSWETPSELREGTDSQSSRL